VNGRGSGPVKVGNVLDGVLQQHGLDGQIKRMAALEIWPQVVGEHIAAVTRARSVEEGRLVVEVRSSGWLMELNMMKGELLGRLNERLPETPLNRVVFVMAETD
jgi:predicted nucleic acid-binding Zn ribbon protein